MSLISSNTFLYIKINIKHLKGAQTGTRGKHSSWRAQILKQKKLLRVSNEMVYALIKKLGKTSV